VSTISTLPIAWFVARGAGLVSFGFLTASVWLGLAMSTRLLGSRRQKRLLGLHRILSWMGLTALGLHAGAILFDPTIGFGPAAVLVPFAAPWHPAAVAGGVVAGWLMLMLAASFRFRNRIGQKTWRKLHYASFAAFLLAMIHAITSGTDLAGIGGPVLALVAGGPVLWLTFVRILTPRAATRPAAAAPAATPPSSVLTRSI
jgi:DMSO/TMAO reductase YedYZ heme-binding membrane subunit